MSFVQFGREWSVSKVVAVPSWRGPPIIGRITSLAKIVERLPDIAMVPRAERIVVCITMVDKVLVDK